jgi:PIN domain nuclease of toxin-antitoxin system
MNILLDTHIVIWWYEDPQRLKEDARKLIEDRGNTLFLSPTVIWEISVKQSLDKLKVPDALIEKAISDLVEIPISIKHTKAINELPFIHNDPFDRILIAQAKVDNLHLMTRDKQIIKYDIKTILA